MLLKSFPSKFHTYNLFNVNIQLVTTYKANTLANTITRISLTPYPLQIRKARNNFRFTIGTSFQIPMEISNVLNKVLRSFLYISVEQLLFTRWCFSFDKMFHKQAVRTTLFILPSEVNKENGKFLLSLLKHCRDLFEERADALKAFSVCLLRYKSCYT